jgi:CubicO group peptidase (beta-lactamase class C family)
VWQPYGMEADAVWMLGSTGHEISGCCVSARLRDYARFGKFIADGGMIGGKSILPDDWIASATTKQADIAQPGRGYGFQWWTNDDGSFAAQGIFGQGIFIDPKRKLVIASNGNWKTATDPDGVGKAREAFYKAVQDAVDAER